VDFRDKIGSRRNPAAHLNFISFFIRI